MAKPKVSKLTIGDHEDRFITNRLEDFIDHGPSSAGTLPETFNLRPSLEKKARNAQKSDDGFRSARMPKAERKNKLFVEGRKFDDLVEELADGEWML